MAPRADPKKFKEAVTWFRERVPMTKANWERLQEEARDHAFTVSGVAELDMVAQVWKSLDRAIEKGTTLADWKKEIAADLREAWGKEQPSNVPWRLETIFRTNVQKAYSAGRVDQLSDPAVVEAFPYWRYSAILDKRTSDLCRPIHGTTLPANDFWWREHTPPLHFNCRSTIIPLSAAEGKGRETKVRPANEAAAGFGRDPRTRWSPDMGKYPTPLAESFGRRQR